MELIANDLSIHSQFRDIAAFRESLGILQQLRESARGYGRQMQCSRDFLNSEPLPGVPLGQAIGQLSLDEQRAVMSWLTSVGPFWDEFRRHSPDDYLECRGEIVTDSGVGEAAFRSLFGVECALVSVVPSHWDYAPVSVALRRDREEGTDHSVALPNWRTVPEVESGLAKAEPPVGAWVDVEQACRRRYSRLVISDDAFGSLSGMPFAKSSAERIVALLGILDRKARAFDSVGALTDEARQIDRDYFSGTNALFTDSSPTEKREFGDRLTFPHPAKRGETLWCPWHGKERHLTLRLHFSWPIRHNEPVYVVHVGRKRTKR